MIPSKVIKTGDSIKLTITNAIHYYGSNNSLFITITLKGSKSFNTLRKKFDAFIRNLPKSILSAISVFGFAPQSVHIHMVAFITPSPPKSDLAPLEHKQMASGKTNHLANIRKLIIRAKQKAKFGRVFNIQSIRIPEAVAGYLRRNYLDTDEYRNRLGPLLGLKFRCFRYYRLPDHLKVNPSTFSRHTESSSRYRCAMTGLANCAGTPIGDVMALETQTGLSFEELRHLAFGLCNTTPGHPQRWPPKLFQNALSEAGSLHNQFKTNRKPNRKPKI